MKAHDLANALRLVSQSLKRAPNIPVEELQFGAPSANELSLRDNAPAALALLVKLSQFSKSEWAALISELGLNVPIKKTDSTRDLLGRLLTYLAKNDDVLNSITARATARKSNVSPELLNALSILMKK